MTTGACRARHRRTVMSNLGLERHLAGLGLELIRTPVGDRYVLEHMRAHGYNIGGEPSGHIILSDYTTTGDGLGRFCRCWRWSSAATAGVEVCHCRALPQVLKNVRFKSGKPLGESPTSVCRHPMPRPASTATVYWIVPAGHRAGDPGRGREGDHKGLVEEVVDGVVDAI
jgi:phosphoglucosamine mutase